MTQVFSQPGAILRIIYKFRIIKKKKKKKEKCESFGCTTKDKNLERQVMGSRNHVDSTSRS